MGAASRCNPRPPPAACTRCRAPTRLFQCSIPTTAQASSSPPAILRRTQTMNGYGWRLRKTEVRCACRGAAAALSTDSCGGPVSAGPLCLSPRDVQSRAANRVRAYSSEKVQTVHHTRRPGWPQEWLRIDEEIQQLNFIPAPQQGPTQRASNRRQHNRNNKARNHSKHHQSLESIGAFEPLQNRQGLRIAGARRRLIDDCQQTLPQFGPLVLNQHDHHLQNRRHRKPEQASQCAKPGSCFGVDRCRRPPLAIEQNRQEANADHRYEWIQPKRQ